MKCPQCNYDMSPVDTGVTHDRSGKTAYDWSKFECKNCDVWIEQEIPQKTE